MPDAFPMELVIRTSILSGSIAGLVAFIGSLIVAYINRRTTLASSKLASDTAITIARDNNAVAIKSIERTALESLAARRRLLLEACCVEVDQALYTAIKLLWGVIDSKEKNAFDVDSANKYYQWDGPINQVAAVKAKLNLIDCHPLASRVLDLSKKLAEINMMDSSIETLTDDIKQLHFLKEQIFREMAAVYLARDTMQLQGSPTPPGAPD